jgi:hypothetical protein
MTIWSTGPELNRRILVLQPGKFLYFVTLTETYLYSKAWKSTQRKTHYGLKMGWLFGHRERDFYRHTGSCVQTGAICRLPELRNGAM